MDEPIAQIETDKVFLWHISLENVNHCRSWLF